MTRLSGRRLEAPPCQGGVDAFGHVPLGGLGEALARQIKARAGSIRAPSCSATSSEEARRTPRDRYLSTLFGAMAAEPSDL